MLAAASRVSRSELLGTRAEKAILALPEAYSDKYDTIYSIKAMGKS
jgi:hypothetical protein